ncbi:ABC transporter ATP-binding protein [Tindallia californiensis]|uniref:Iron complex transport system ATP-binding protein n=1 Tax=Tindallia californiensis TaxID=159292 RepID=A0A1H3R6Q3_9FIRM|nr:ABC transporter ATP-binding protein [Tindallia californiensis]SDZ20918.1 iron complex transport system ATP-binding protein [Tindallia californiensis]
MIEMKQASFEYKKNQLIFQEVSWELSKGETLSILGPNGVGKTTLIKCLMGFQALKSGEVLLDGISIPAYAPKEFFQRVSYVPQAKHIIFPYSVLDMVLLGRASSIGLYSKPSSHDIAMAKEAIRKVGIENLTHRSTRQISGGQLQLVLMARAIVNQPEVLVLDEPESNLDMKNQLMILDLLERLREELALTIIINTHYPNHALRLGGKALLLGQDDQKSFGEASDLINDEKIRAYFHVDSQMVEWQEEEKKHQRIFPLRISKEAV